MRVFMVSRIFSYDGILKARKKSYYVTFEAMSTIRMPAALA